MFYLWLLAIAVPPSLAQVLPQQTKAYHNYTAGSGPTSITHTPPITMTGPKTSITPPPPCCWVIAGSFALGINRWWDSSVTEHVATVVTQFLSYNNTVIPANSTTIYHSRNESISYGLYGATSLPDPIMTELGVPDNILQSDFLDDDGNYAQTYLGSGNVQTWSYTDLRLTSPTPYNEWHDLGILTVTPEYYLSVSLTSQLQSYEMSQCGFWQTTTVYTLTTGDAITSTDSYQYFGTSGTETFDVTMTTSAWPVLVTTSAFWPSGWPETEVWFEDPIFEDADCDTDEMFPPPPEPAGVYGGCALNATYVQPVAYQMPDGNWPLVLPGGLINWLADQSSIIAKYPYINSCWTINGVGQPTVHVAVIQLTTTSTHFITMGGAYTASTTSEATVFLAESSNAASDKVSSANTQTQAPVPTSAVVSSSTQTLRASTTASTLIDTIQTTLTPSSTPVPSPQDSPDTSLSGSLVSNAETGHQSLEAFSTAQEQSSQATSNGVGVLLSAISSVAQQQAQSKSSTPDGGISKIKTSTGTSVAGERPAQTRPGSTSVVANGGGVSTTYTAPGGGASVSWRSDTVTPMSISGFIIGSQTISPGGPAVSSGGTTYSALLSGSGLKVLADGTTSTFYASRVDGTTALSARPTDAAVVRLATDHGYQVGDYTITAGGSAATVSGTVYSVLSLGTGVQVVAGGLTSTARLVSASGAAIVPLGSEGGYQIIGQTITAGGNAIFISGSTYSALPSGSGVVVVAAGMTSTAKPLPVSTTSALRTLAGGMIIFPVALAASGTSLADYTLPYQSLGVSKIVVGHQTLSVGGPAVTDGSQTLSLELLEGSLAIVIDGSSTTVLPTRTAQRQTVTVGGQTYVGYATSSAIIIDGTTIYPGSATVLGGETVTLSGTDFVIATGNDVSTEGLGAAIMSGLAGSTAPTTTPAPSGLSTVSGQVVTAQTTSTAPGESHTSTAWAFTTLVPSTVLKSVMAIALALVLY